MNQYLWAGVGVVIVFMLVARPVTFIAILMTILIQATTTKWLAKKLDLLVEE